MKSARTSVRLSALKIAYKSDAAWLIKQKSETLLSQHVIPELPNSKIRHRPTTYKFPIRNGSETSMRFHNKPTLLHLAPTTRPVTISFTRIRPEKNICSYICIPTLTLFAAVFSYLLISARQRKRRIWDLKDGGFNPLVHILWKPRSTETYVVKNISS